MSNNNGHSMQSVSPLPTPLSRDETLITIDQLQHLVRILDQSDVSELEMRFAENNARLVLRKARSQDEPTELTGTLSPLSSEQETSSPTTKQHIVRSQCVGIFHLWSSSKAPLSLSVGDSIKEGQHIGVLQSLDILNEVEAPVTGHIVEILVEDGQPVEFGKPLFHIDAE